MAITNGYCTLAEFKAFNKITSTDSTDDSVIEDIIEGVSRDIDKKCGRVFYQVNETRYFDTNNSRHLEIDDIYTTSGLTIYTSLNDDGTYEYTWTATDYELVPYSPKFGFPYTGIEIAINGDYAFSVQRKGNKITANFGWSAVPDDIKLVAIHESMNEYHRRFGENLSATATVTASGVVLTPKGFADISVQRLSPYRKLNV